MSSTIPPPPGQRLQNHLLLCPAQPFVTQWQLYDVTSVHPSFLLMAIVVIVPKHYIRLYAEPLNQ